LGKDEVKGALTIDFILDWNSAVDYLELRNTNMGLKLSASNLSNQTEVALRSQTEPVTNTSVQVVEVKIYDGAKLASNLVQTIDFYKYDGGSFTQAEANNFITNLINTKHVVFVP
jgi:hypothetical protein